MPRLLLVALLVGFGFPGLSHAQEEKEIEILKLQDELKRSNEELKQRAVELEKAKDELKKRTDEMKVLQAAIQKREAQILELQAEARTLRNQAIASDNTAKANVARMQVLMLRLQELERTLAGKDAKLEVPPRDPAANPPAAYVKGQVTKVDKAGLVEINLGTDAGLAKDNTLEVFRLQPRPEYVGTLRIVEVGTQTAIGRMGKAAGKKEIKAGDIVASSLDKAK